MVLDHPTCWTRTVAAAAATPSGAVTRMRWERLPQLAHFHRPIPRPPLVANLLLVRPWEGPSRQAYRRVELLLPSFFSHHVYGDGNACAGGGLRHCSIHYIVFQSGRLCSLRGMTYPARCQWSPRPCAPSYGRGWYGAAAHARCGSRRDSRSIPDT